MSKIVIDPGHGGQKDIVFTDENGNRIKDSSCNNATSPSKVLEKDITLDLAKRVRNSLVDGAAATYKAKKDIEVFLTRDSDMNVSFADRTGVAADHLATVYLSIHFNAQSVKPKETATARGTECWIDRKYMMPVSKDGEGPGDPDSGLRNVNVADDERFAKAIADATVSALATFDKAAKLRSNAYTIAKHGEKYAPPSGVKMKGLGTLRDASLRTGDRKCYACLLEVDFLNHPNFDALWNGANAGDVRTLVADSIAKVIVDFC
jgi:N-acetylmuramoyl-L-alanine amidase